VTQSAAGVLVAFMPDVLATPQLEIQLEHIQRHLDRGGSAVVLRCDGELPTCEVNPGHEAAVCAECRERFANGMRWLRGAATEEPFYSLTDHQEAFIQTLVDRSWRTAEEIRALRVDGADIGMAAFSTLVGTTHEASPDLSQHQESLRRNLSAAATVYLSLKSQLERLGADRLTVFNGRLSSTRPAVRAAQSLGIECDVLETAGRMERYAVFKRGLPHDLEVVKQAIEDELTRAPLSAAGCELALEWFRERRAGLTRDWPSFTRHQAADVLPVELTPDRTNIVIFRSSEYELAGIDSWRNPFYSNQNAGIDRLLTDLRDDRVRVFLRVHPGQHGMDTTETREIEALGRNHANLVVIPAASAVSTYALMDAADAVLTYGSTTGIEAAFAGKLSILMGRAEYEDLDVCLRPRSHEELVALIRRVAAGQLPDRPSGPRMGLVKYGHFQQTFGELHKYVKRTGFFSAYMQRGESVEAIEGGLSFPLDSQARIEWRADGVDEVEIRIDRPDGPLFARGGASGAALTGPWIRKGMRFLLCACLTPATETEVLASVEVLFGGDGWDTRPVSRRAEGAALDVHVLE
jgi:hypothetical protein